MVVLSEERGTARLDIYAQVTETIVQAVEAGAGAWHMPWHSSEAPLHRPRNVVSGLPYKGINILVLWAQGELNHYETGLWATYRQWQELGAQVRKGERGTTVVYYKQIPLEARDLETGDIVRDYRLIARAFTVFNGAQVDGWKPWEPEPIDLVKTHEEIENFIDMTGADIRSAGDRAYFDRMGNCIFIPDRIRFRGSPTSSATEGYYGTVFHELVHWTGHHLRLCRDLSGRYGSEAYAMEELIAELGAAYLCMEFGVTNVPRPDPCCVHRELAQGVQKRHARRLCRFDARQPGDRVPHVQLAEGPPAGAFFLSCGRPKSGRLPSANNHCE